MMSKAAWEKKLAKDKAEEALAAQQKKVEVVGTMYDRRLVLYLHKKLEAKEKENASLREDIGILVRMVEKYFQLYMGGVK